MVDAEGVMLTWEQAFMAGTSLAGGKGWHLSRLDRYGFLVPRGGVLSSAVYEELFTTPDIAAQVAALRTVEADAVTDERVQDRLATLRQHVLRLDLPRRARDDVERFLREHGLHDRRVAVRSSAAAEDGGAQTFAGIHDSVLNVTGSDAVCDAIAQCFASLWTPHAVAYRRRFGVDDEDTACAVVLCEMVGNATTGPVAAGVAFSCDPRTGQRQLVTVNLTSGLGDAVVQGTVEPLEHTIRFAGDGTQVERTDTTGRPNVLDEPQLVALARLVTRVYWALGEGRHPQDVEWAFDGTSFWVLQSRPVTRLPRWTFPGVPTRTSTWSGANITDSFPNPVTTMTWSFLEVSAQDIVYASLHAMRYPVPAGMEVLRRVGGRPYFDLDSLQWALYDAMGVPPAETNRAMGGFQPEIVVPPGNPLRGRSGRRRARRRLRLLGRLWRFHLEAPRQIGAVVTEARQSRTRDLCAYTSDQLLEELRRLGTVGLAYQPILQLAATYFGVWMMLMQDVLEHATGDRAQSLVTRLLAASGDVASAEQGYGLRDLATLAATEPAARQSLQSSDPFAWRSLDQGSAFRVAMERYLDRFGHRAVFEMEFASRRWCEDPTYLLDQIRFHLQHADAPDQRAHATRVRDEAEHELRRVPWHVRPVVRWALGRARRGAALRENAKSGSAACVALIRHFSQEVGRRLVAAGHIAAVEDVFHLGIVEVEAFLDGSWDGAGAARLVEDRTTRLAADTGRRCPGVILGDAGEAPPAAPPPETGVTAGPLGDAHTWRGLAAAPGLAEGTACVLSSPHDARRMNRQDVLVAPSTDPGWTPLFLRASAVVMETGGYLSHGAVVAREFGLPAVVNVHDAMVDMRDGDRLRVDGDEGVVARLAGP
jgi:pyruvate,water dikinase